MARPTVASRAKVCIAGGLKALGTAGIVGIGVTFAATAMRPVTVVPIGSRLAGAGPASPAYPGYAVDPAGGSGALDLPISIDRSSADGLADPSMNIASNLPPDLSDPGDLRDPADPRDPIGPAAPVPEPSSATPLATALLALAVLRRSRQPRNVNRAELPRHAASDR